MPDILLPAATAVVSSLACAAWMFEAIAARSSKSCLRCGLLAIAFGFVAFMCFVQFIVELAHA